MKELVGDIPAEIGVEAETESTETDVDSPVEEEPPALSPSPRTVEASGSADCSRADWGEGSLPTTLQEAPHPAPSPGLLGEGEVSAAPDELIEFPDLEDDFPALTQLVELPELELEEPLAPEPAVEISVDTPAEKQAPWSSLELSAELTEEILTAAPPVESIEEVPDAIPAFATTVAPAPLLTDEVSEPDRLQRLEASLAGALGALRSRRMPPASGAANCRATAFSNPNISCSAGFSARNRIPIFR